MKINIFVSAQEHLLLHSVDLVDSEHFQRSFMKADGSNSSAPSLVCVKSKSLPISCISKSISAGHSGVSHLDIANIAQH